MSTESEDLDPQSLGFVDCGRKLANAGLAMMMCTLPCVAFETLDAHAGLGMSMFYLFSLLAYATLVAALFSNRQGRKIVLRTRPERMPALEHLPPQLVTMVHEVRTLRAELAAGIDPLESAWRLAQDLERAPAPIRDHARRCGASLDPVVALSEASVRARGRAAPDPRGRRPPAADARRVRDQQR
ncbi:MAG: hypothetical protein KC457_12615, partial [Myxococcales bacterium]|nr:hypothetical protein [Myxococcales bacterium]